MLDHIILTVRNFKEATAFYEAVLPHLNIQERHDYDGKNGPPGHPDLKGFGANGRMFFWLREGTPYPDAVHIGFVANSEKAVQTACNTALLSKVILGFAPRNWATSLTHHDLQRAISMTDTVPSA